MNGSDQQRDQDPSRDAGLRAEGDRRPGASGASGGLGSLGEVGVIVVDHGSRRQESNDMLLELAARFAQRWGYRIVEPAHMELAEPSIATAFDRCVERGAETVLVSPYFLLPGRHWYRDIPTLTREAAKRHPEVPFLVAAPLGLHPLVLQVMQDRIEHCLRHALEGAPACDVCQGGETCQLSRESSDDRGL